MSEAKQQDLFDEEHRKEELSTIDQLFEDVKRYRRGSEFKKKLEFYSNFPYLGVYNAELVSQQRPGAKLVLTAKKWEEKYNRKIRINARPLIILIPFYPVDFLFDVTDTKPIDNAKNAEDNAIIEEIINEFKASCINHPGYYMEKLEMNLEKNGIYYDYRYHSGSDLKAEIKVDNSEILNVQIYKDVELPHHNHFTIGVNPEANLAEKLALIFHELGHLFCHHIKCSWWETRECTTTEKEFEAETVSYLVCKRLGIETKSVEYLANYFESLDKIKYIPKISAELVFQAVDLIQDMASGYMSVVDCLLYKKDKEFKVKVDIERERKKKEREQRKSF